VLPRAQTVTLDERGGSIEPRVRAGRPGFRRVLVERRAAIFALCVFVAGWLAFIFAGTLARANELEAQAAAARVRKQELSDRVAAGAAEIEYIQSDAYREIAARALGLGSPEEVPFRLPPDAPSPAPVAMLGSSADDVAESSPLEEWLQLLLGT
jgi:cell division protein FtsB